MSDLNRLNPGRHSLHSRNNLSRGESRLHDLIMQAEGWWHTAQTLEARLPAKLQQHCRAVRVREGVLVWYASNNMAAAGRLPAWRTVCPEVREVQVKISPPEQERPKEKQAKLSRTAAEQCLAAADDLAHHPELAAALRHLARHAEESE